MRLMQVGADGLTTRGLDTADLLPRVPHTAVSGSRPHQGWSHSPTFRARRWRAGQVCQMGRHSTDPGTPRSNPS